MNRAIPELKIPEQQLLNNVVYGKRVGLVCMKIYLLAVENQIYYSFAWINIASTGYNKKTLLLKKKSSILL